jgi:hypothetical protein
VDQRDGHHTSAPERVCCLLVLDSVTSTPQWIRQPKPRGCLHDVCVFVCECVLGRSQVSQPLNLRLCLLQHFGFLTSLVPSRLAAGAMSALPGSSASLLPPLTPLDGPFSSPVVRRCRVPYTCLVRVSGIPAEGTEEGVLQMTFTLPSPDLPLP